MTGRLAMIPGHGLLVDALRDPRHQSQALFGLAEACHKLLGTRSAREFFLISFGTISHSLTSALHGTLAFRGTPVRLDLDVFRRESALDTELPPGSTVVLLTDLIHSGYSIRKAAESLTRSGHRVFGALAVFDLRPEGADSVGICVESVVVDHGYVSIHPLPPDQIRHQHPPVVGTIEQVYRTSESVLALGHVLRPGGPHAFAVIDVLRIVSDRRTYQLAAQAILDALTAQDHDQVIDIFYPRDEGEFSAALARNVASVLRDHGMSVCLHSIPVGAHLITGGGDGEIRQAISVFLDWGAVSGNTIVRAIESLIRTTDRALIAILLTSQLPNGIESLLEQTSTLVCASCEPEGREMRFAFKVLEPGFAGRTVPATCSQCRVRHQLRYLHGRAKVGPVQEHLRVKLSQIALQPTATLIKQLRTSGIPFYGAILDSSDVVEVLRLKQHWGDAARSEAGLLELVNEVEGLPTASLSTQLTWLRLFALDSDQLHGLPFDLPEVRDSIARTCVGVLNTQREQHGWLATLVLRCASKKVFLEHLSILVGDGGDVASREALVGLFSLLSTEEYREPSLLRACLESIEDALTCLEGGAKDIRESLRALRLVAALQVGVGEAELDALAAWKSLQIEYSRPQVEHDPSIPGARNVWALVMSRQAEEAARGRQDAVSPGSWAAAVRDWDESMSRITSHVLPYLPHIEACLHSASEAYRAVLSVSQLATLHGFIGHEGLDRLELIRRQLIANAEDPKSLTPQSLGLLRKALEPWHELVLRGPKKQPGTNIVEDGATLMRILNEMPSHPKEAWDWAVRERREQYDFAHQWNGASTGGAVFLPRRVLQFVLSELLDNAVSERHKPQGSDERITVRASMLVRATNVELRISNTGTVVSSTPGHGLQRIEAILRPFGGALNVVRPQGLWTFELVLVVRRWGQSRIKGEL